MHQAAFSNIGQERKIECTMYFTKDILQLFHLFGARGFKKRRFKCLRNVSQCQRRRNKKVTDYLI